MGMAVARRGHGNSSREIEEFVAVHVGDNNSVPAFRDQGIRTRIRRRYDLLVGLEHALGVGAGQRGLDLGSDRSGHCLGSHWSLSVNQPVAFADWLAIDSRGMTPRYPVCDLGRARLQSCRPTNRFGLEPLRGALK